MGWLLRILIMLLVGLSLLFALLTWFSMHLPMDTGFYYIGVLDLKDERTYQIRLTDMKRGLQVVLINVACDLGDQALGMYGYYANRRLVVRDSDGVSVALDLRNGEHRRCFLKPV